MLKVGFSPQIRRQITKSHLGSAAVEPRHGLHKVQRFKNGKREDLFYGYMENVCMSPTSLHCMT
jgi:hypothetical protein